MIKDRWSDYAKYLVLSDNSGCKLTGNFGTYQDFKTVREVINSIAFSDKNTYLHNNNIYNRKITSTEGKIILTNIKECKWNEKTEKMILVANQLKLRI
jgi:superfamily I DNA and RNA helicase